MGAENLEPRSTRFSFFWWGTGFVVNMLLITQIFNVIIKLIHLNSITVYYVHIVSICTIYIYIYTEYFYYKLKVKMYYII